MQSVHLLVIDPQHDFCDPDGALFVPGADEDVERLTLFVDRVRDKLEMIHVTLDCHHFIDIAHPIFWLDKDGKTQLAEKGDGLRPWTGEKRTLSTMRLAPTLPHWDTGEQRSRDASTCFSGLGN